MVELAHVSVRVDLKDPLEKVKRTCALIEAVTKAKEEDELASVFVSKMQDQVEVCHDYLHEALAQLMAIGSGHIHGDTTTSFDELDHGEFHHNRWDSSSTPLPEVFGGGVWETTPVAEETPYSTPSTTTAWSVVARPGEDWGDVIDLGPETELSRGSAPQYDTFDPDEVDAEFNGTDIGKDVLYGSW